MFNFLTKSNNFAINNKVSYVVGVATLLQRSVSIRGTFLLSLYKVGFGIGYDRDKPIVGDPCSIDTSTQLLHVLLLVWPIIFHGTAVLSAISLN